MSSKMCVSSSVDELETELIDLGKKLVLHLPSSNVELLNLLQQLETILCKVNQEPSESMIDAMKPITEAMISKHLVKHPDIDVNISVAYCICEVLRIMVSDSPYNDQQMVEFFELVVLTFEKLSSSSGGCYTKMTKVVEIFSRNRLSVMMVDMQLDGLVVRLFKQFLSFADSNSSAIVLEMENIMTTAIVNSEEDELTLELARLLVTSVKKDNQIASPVCWQLGENVLKNCAAQLKPHLLDLGILFTSEETNQSTSETSKLRKDATHKTKLRDSQVEKKHEKKKLSSADPQITLKSESKVTGKRKRNNAPLKEQAQSFENSETLVGRKIKVWWPKDKQYYVGVVKSFNCVTQKHKVSVERNGVEELLNLKLHRRGLPENKSPMLDSTSSGNGGDKELLDVKRKPCELVEVVSPMSDCVRIDDGHEGLLNLKKEQSALLKNVSPMSICQGHDSSQSGIIYVQGYKVKQSIAPTLVAIIKKYGDIAAECIFNTASVRSSFLEVICEVVRQIQTDSITETMEEIECHMSDAEKANINVSWLRAHLEAIRKTKEVKKNSILLIETKGITVSAKRAAQMDLKERREELMDAQERFVKAERCVKILDFVEKSLSNSILESKAEKDLLVVQPVL